MNKLRRMMLDFMQLSPQERAELLEMMKNYNSKPTNIQLNEQEVIRKSLGPLNMGYCSSCGRG